MEPLGSELEERSGVPVPRTLQLPSGEEEVAAVMRDHGLLWPDPQVLKL